MRFLVALALGLIGLQALALPVHAACHALQNIQDQHTGGAVLSSPDCDLCTAYQASSAVSPPAPVDTYLPVTHPCSPERAEAEAPVVFHSVPEARGPPVLG